MSCCMCAKVLLDSADIGYLFQVAVHILIARNRKQHPSFDANRVVLVLFENCQRDIQQRDIAHIICLLACLANPIVSVVVLHDMLGGELLNIYKCQSRKGRKKHQSKGDGNKENQTERVVKQRFCGCLPLQSNSKERQDNARFPLPSHYLSCYQLKA